MTEPGPAASGAHHRDEAVGWWELALEFDYRLYWLRAASGRNFAALANIVDTACRVPSLPLGSSRVRSHTTATVAIFDVASGRTLQTCVTGSVDEAFDFRGGQRERSWETGDVRGAVALRGRGDGFSLELRTSTCKSPARFHDVGFPDGTIVNGELGPSCYAISTALEVEGIVQVEGRRETVVGAAWRDRQWLKRRMIGAGATTPFAWRWFAIQLVARQVELMLYEMWNPVTRRMFKRFGGLVEPDGGVRTLPEETFAITTEARDTSEGHSVESAWRIALPDSLGTLQLTRIACPARIDTRAAALRHSYFEGPCIVEGAGPTIRAWAEQVDSRWLRLELPGGRAARG